MVSSSQRESSLGVLGVALGLLLLVGTVATLAGRRRGPVDGAALLAEWTTTDTLPFGLQLVAAKELSSGETVLDLAPAEIDQAHDGEEAGFQAPDQVSLVRYPRAAALARFFRPAEREGEEGLAAEIDRKRKAWEQDPEKTFHATIDEGEVEWGDWRTNYVVERAFLEDGRWRDSVRVNLGSPDRALALLAAWPPEREFSEEALRSLLSAISVASVDAR